MPDVTFYITNNQNVVKVHCVYIPDAILSICRMSLLLTKMKVHCVYMPDAILSICRMSRLLCTICESALCLYSGCHSVYMPNVTFDDDDDDDDDDGCKYWPVAAGCTQC